jgi:hypothetical protein
METPKQMIEEKFKGSDFILTYETDETVGYRCGLKSEISRTVCVHLEQRTVEYELVKRGMPNENRVEHFETLDRLPNYIPSSASSFDLKLRGLKLETNRAAAKTATGPNASTMAEDPWNLANYFAMPRGGKAHSPTGLKLADVDLSK